VLLQKGYGYADLKKKSPVDPSTTIFRLASISKLFTWVSVMQLQEQGKLDLDTDVNRYLDFQNPAGVRQADYLAQPHDAHRGLRGNNPLVSYNSAGGGDKPREEIIDMFTDRYFPGTTNRTYISLPRNELSAIEGVYESTRREDSTKAKLDGLFSQRTARVDKEGSLHLGDIKDLRNHPIKWKPIGKDLWQEIDGQRRVFAIRGQGGRVVRLAYDFPGVQSQRVPWYEHSKFVLIAVAGSLIVLLAVVLAALIRVGQEDVFA